MFRQDFLGQPGSSGHPLSTLSLSLERVQLRQNLSRFHAQGVIGLGKTIRNHPVLADDVGCWKGQLEAFVPVVRRNINAKLLVQRTIQGIRGITNVP